MKIDDDKIMELKKTAIERALSEGYTIVKEGIKIEDLKLFSFDSGETDFIIADTMDNAIGFYIQMVGEEEVKECEVDEIKDWHGMKLREEQDDGSFKDITFLESAKEAYQNGYNNPAYIASTCY